MKILFIGDVIGKAGREAVEKYLPELKQELNPDCIIVNGENAAHGMGLTPKIAEAFFDLGVDCITTGNHVWDKPDIIPYIKETPAVIRPLNYPQGTPGEGSFEFETKNAGKIQILNAMGRLFMDALDDPFDAVDKAVGKLGINEKYQAIFVDFHAETTSETMCYGHFLNGRVSAVIGTHTHVPTADHHIMSQGTAFQCDAGMTGCYDSVIGFEHDVPVSRFVTKMPSGRLQPREGDVTLCGCFIQTDPETGLATSIDPIRRGGLLSQV